MRRGALAAAALALAATQAHALNKCIDAHGKVSYQNLPCPEHSRQQKVTVMPGPRHDMPAPRTDPAIAAGLLPAAQDRPDPRMDEAVSIVTRYEGCESASPAFAHANAAHYQEWRRANGEILDRLPRSRHYMAVLQAERVRVRGELAQPDMRKAFLQSCEAELAPAIAPPKPSR